MEARLLGRGVTLMTERVAGEPAEERTASVLSVPAAASAGGTGAAGSTAYAPISQGSHADLVNGWY